MQGKSLLYGITGLVLLGIAALIYNSQVNSNSDSAKISTSAQKTYSNAGSEISVTHSLMELTSNAFGNNENIPSKYTCDSDDISPPLNISEAPAETVSFALIVDDPDAQNGDWVHWVVFNIPSTITSIGEDASPGGIEGTTDFGQTGWGGPCPPSGTHRYIFKLYALDTDLDLDSSTTKAELEIAMTGHVLDRAELIGKYQRQ